MKWWEKLPVWARWFLYVPAVLIVCIAGTLVITTIPRLLFSFSHFGQLVFDTFTTAVSSVFLMAMAYELAPSAKRVALLVWVVLGVLLSLLGIVGGVGRLWMGYESMSWKAGTELAQSLMALLVIGTFGASYLGEKRSTSGASR